MQLDLYGGHVNVIPEEPGVYHENLGVAGLLA